MKYALSFLFGVLIIAPAIYYGTDQDGQAAAQRACVEAGGYAQEIGGECLNNPLRPNENLPANVRQRDDDPLKRFKIREDATEAQKADYLENYRSGQCPDAVRLEDLSCPASYHPGDDTRLGA